MADDEHHEGPAEPLWATAAPELPADVEVEHFDPAGARPPRTGRSHVVTGALIALGVAAVFVIAGVLLGAGGDGGTTTTTPQVAWSAWKPSKSGEDGARQVAAHVAPRYREAGGQLVLVQSGPLQVAGVPLTVAQQDPAVPQALQVYDGKTVLFRLCGDGRDCAIARGTPSIQRHMLLRREALELGLYSLRYLDGVDQIVVFMPPRRGAHASQALFFRKAAVLDQLQKPLEATLVDRAPSVAGVRRSPDAGLVQQLTLPSLFRFHVSAGRTSDRALLVLQPIQLGGAAPAPAPRPATSDPNGPSLS